MVLPSGVLSPVLVNLLRDLINVANGTISDVAAIQAATSTTTTSSTTSIAGSDGIAVYGSPESGYQIVLTGEGAASPLVAQVFGS